MNGQSASRSTTPQSEIVRDIQTSSAFSETVSSAETRNMRLRSTSRPSSRQSDISEEVPISETVSSAETRNMRLRSTSRPSSRQADISEEVPISETVSSAETRNMRLRSTSRPSSRQSDISEEVPISEAVSSSKTRKMRLRSTSRPGSRQFDISEVSVSEAVSSSETRKMRLRSTSRPGSRQFDISEVSVETLKTRNMRKRRSASHPASLQLELLTQNMEVDEKDILQSGSLKFRFASSEGTTPEETRKMGRGRLALRPASRQTLANKQEGTVTAETKKLTRLRAKSHPFTRQTLQGHSTEGTSTVSTKGPAATKENLNSRQSDIWEKNQEKGSASAWSSSTLSNSRAGTPESSGSTSTYSSLMGTNKDSHEVSSGTLLAERNSPTQRSNSNSPCFTAEGDENESGDLFTCEESSPDSPPHASTYASALRELKARRSIRCEPRKYTPRLTSYQPTPFIYTPIDLKRKRSPSPQENKPEAKKSKSYFGRLQGAGCALM